VKSKNIIDRYYLLFLCIVWIVLIVGLGNYGLAETSEARYAEISREMFLSGDYLNPKLLGIFHFHKPPITYYITTLGYRIFGVNEFGARFFLQIAIVIQLVLVYRLANLLYKDKRIAFMAGLIYFSFPIVLISSRNLTTDAFLTTLVIGSVYCWQVYEDKTKIGFLYLFYTLIGIALLTKGPVALLFILTYIIIRKLLYKGSIKMTLHHMIGFLLCFSVSVSWYIAIIVEHPKIWDYFIHKQILGRITGNAYSERSKPFWYYLPILLGLLLPWCLSLLPHLKNLKSLFPKQKETKVLIYASTILVFLFSAFSTKLILYILPVFWMIAISIAAMLPKISKASKNIVNITYAGLILALVIGLFFSRVYISEMEYISVKTLIIAFISLIVFGVIYYAIDTTKDYKPAVLAAVFGCVIISISTSFMTNHTPIINSTRDMVKFIDHVSKEKDKTIIVYDYLLSSIPFYTDDKHITLKYSSNTTQRETQFEENNAYQERLWDLNEKTELYKLLETSKKQSTYLLVRNKRDLDKKFKAVKDSFDHQKHFEKWTLYYN
jgi:4-amino-4-deoxy-L-arabinose transferase